MMHSVLDISVFKGSLPFLSVARLNYTQARATDYGADQGGKAWAAGTRAFTHAAKATLARLERHENWEVVLLKELGI